MQFDHMTNELFLDEADGDDVERVVRVLVERAFPGARFAVEIDWTLDEKDETCVQLRLRPESPIDSAAWKTFAMEVAS